MIDAGSEDILFPAQGLIFGLISCPEEWIPAKVERILLLVELSVDNDRGKIGHATLKSSDSIGRAER